MGFRRSFQGWVGALTLAFGVCFINTGLSLLATSGNDAKGVVLWSSPILIMTGLAIVVEAMGRKSSYGKSRAPVFNFPITPIVANLFSFIAACTVIALLTYSIYDSHLSQDAASRPLDFNNVISVFSTVIFMAIMLLILSLSAMFIECCGSFIFVATPGHEVRGPYDHPPRGSGPAIVYR